MLSCFSQPKAALSVEQDAILFFSAKGCVEGRTRCHLVLLFPQAEVVLSVEQDAILFFSSKGCVECRTRCYLVFLSQRLR